MRALLLLLLPLVSIADTSVYVGGSNVETSDKGTESDYVGVGLDYSLNPYLSLTGYYGDEVTTRDGRYFIEIDEVIVDGEAVGVIRDGRYRLKTNEIYKAGAELNLPLNSELALFAGGGWLKAVDEHEYYSVGAKLNTGRYAYKAEYFNASRGVSGIGISLGLNL